MVVKVFGPLDTLKNSVNVLGTFDFSTSVKFGNKKNYFPNLIDYLQLSTHTKIGTLVNNISPKILNYFDRSSKNPRHADYFYVNIVHMNAAKINIIRN